MTFTITITEGPDTRWTEGPDEIAKMLGILVESMARVNSSGKIPAIAVHHDHGTPFRNEPCKRCQDKQPGAGA